jgi:nitroreductase
MDVKKAIKKRRAYRSLESIDIDEKLINDLAECAKLSESCFNNQPWNYIFVYDKEKLQEMHASLSKGNDWAKKASMIIAVIGKKDSDCVIYERIYYRFDIGLATQNIILRATELGLVAHPIAGYSPKKTRKILGIPDDYDVITLVIVGKKSEKIDPNLSNKQIEAEKNRPKRKKIKDFVHHNKFKGK